MTQAIADRIVLGLDDRSDGSMESVGIASKHTKTAQSGKREMRHSYLVAFGSEQGMAPFCANGKCQCSSRVSGQGFPGAMLLVPFQFQ